jgi:hypothetical protein
MINMLLMVLILGAITIALGVDIGALLAWAKKRWR